MESSGGPVHEYGGARVAVALHEQELRLFVETWRKARAAGVRLPASEDPSYASYEALLRHVLRWARGYMVWICEKLELPDPRIRSAPEVDTVVMEADSYLEHLMAAWRTPLRDVPEIRFFREIHDSPWGVPFCVDAMLEHAVMHPVRHRFQLEELLGER